MLAIIICLLGTWLLIKFTKTESSVLGVKPTRRRLLHFVAGFGFASLAGFIYYGACLWLLKADWEFNPNYGFSEMLGACFWTLRSVLFEELVWRGILLYLLMKYLGTRTGILISAISFGIFHWFSYEILGNYGQMLTVFLLTGIAGIIFGYAYNLTGSLYLPVSLHFGWNFVSIVIFSQGPFGDQLLLITTQNELEGLISLLVFLLQLFILPGIVLLYFYFLKRNRKIPIAV
ncbi:CPBP family intramembrane metalloprotease [Gramella sp. GC03-9]|uniref:CPBP family intramembrane metalloprotease n=1 Tax=Christiangramia oceanisediminis TaxID=2920386 RepID=A0A9X2I8N0_9FLAO|nr:CPBP family intramembrane glutamic endopeptidase [Gramella oceanisediminis]MCP9199476.1 CPBP family intramembrane metalloprotease [Gramella oceanisediminis]